MKVERTPLQQIRWAALAAVTAIACGGSPLIAQAATHAELEQRSEFHQSILNATVDYASPGNLEVAFYRSDLYKDFYERHGARIEFGSAGLVWFMGSGRRKILLTISANTSSYNAFTAATSPTDQVDVILTVNTGVIVSGSAGSNSIPGNPGGSAVAAAGFAHGSTLKAANNGSLYGGGGGGCDGATATAPTIPNGGVGGAGGAAISLDANITLTVDNTNGYIFGGGGGGGGGAADSIGIGPWTSGAAGGGGAGAQGGGTAQGGNGGSGFGSGSAGSAATSGSTAGPGTGGAAGIDFSGVVGGHGGNGGAWATAGVTATNGAQLGRTGGLGGAPGKAIALNGSATPAWLGGNNSTQVKGAIA